jgi:fermentation-respiration switch protein FrsA (DUF1100 family)
MSSRRIHQSVRDDRPIRGGRRLTLDIRLGEAGERVPCVLLLPALAADAPAPAALLLHGYSSHKEQMANSIGTVLLGHGIASLAIDLPLHGERRGDFDSAALSNPMELMRRWNGAKDDARLALNYLAARADVDAGRVALVGYSMGSFLGVLVAAKHPAVKAVVLAAGGDLPDRTPFGRLVRVAADPLRAVRQLDGRPLLMVHGRHDRTVTPAQAQRLFDAAEEPKELRWWDAGHYLPTAAIDDAAAWLERRLA